MENVAVRNEDDGLRTDWAVKTEKVSIVIPSRNNLRYLQRCLETLVNRTTYPNYEIFVVDNHSTDEAVLVYYTQLLENNKNIRVLPYDMPFNFSQACNMGAAAATGSLLLFLNNDVEIVEGGWLDELVRVVQLPGVGIAGARLTYPGGSLQHAGIVVGMTGHANHVGIKSKAWGKGPYGPANVRRNVSAVTGACMLVRSDVFMALHGFSEDYKLVFNDVDICVRAIQAGWRVVMTPFANLIHYEGRSRSRTIPPEDIQLAYHDIARWVEMGDPYYNPNLSLAITRPVFRSRSEMPSLRRLQLITTILGGEGS
jgi:GT2 family glycosyltransferase